MLGAHVAEGTHRLRCVEHRLTHVAADLSGHWRAVQGLEVFRTHVAHRAHRLRRVEHRLAHLAPDHAARLVLQGHVVLRAHVAEGTHRLRRVEHRLADAAPHLASGLRLHRFKVIRPHAAQGAGGQGIVKNFTAEFTFHHVFFLLRIALAMAEHLICCLYYPTTSRRLSRIIPIKHRFSPLPPSGSPGTGYPGRSGCPVPPLPSGCSPPGRPGIPSGSRPRSERQRNMWYGWQSPGRRPPPPWGGGRCSQGPACRSPWRPSPAPARRRWPAAGESPSLP